MALSLVTILLTSIKDKSYSTYVLIKQIFFSDAELQSNSSSSSNGTSASQIENEIGSLKSQLASLLVDKIGDSSLNESGTWDSFKLADAESTAKAKELVSRIDELSQQLQQIQNQDTNGSIENATIELRPDGSA
jgi:hypothetical protein